MAPTKVVDPKMFEIASGLIAQFYSLTHNYALSIGLVAVVVMAGSGMTADLNRQAIIFNEKTPGVFSCPPVCYGDRHTDRHAWEDGFQ